VISLYFLIMYPDRFKKEPSKRTPWIILEPGKIFIMGRSVLENPGDLYRPVHEWVTEYAELYSGITTIELGFEYINSSSTKWIFTIIKELAKMKEMVQDLRVTWYYEKGDEDMIELGIILQSLVDCPLVVVEVEEMNRAGIQKILSGSD
jgi:hypothetical protein